MSGVLEKQRFQAVDMRIREIDQDLMGSLLDLDVELLR